MSCVPYVVAMLTPCVHHAHMLTHVCHHIAHQRTQSPHLTKLLANEIFERTRLCPYCTHYNKRAGFSPFPLVWLGRQRRQVCV